MKSPVEVVVEMDEGLEDKGTLNVNFQTAGSRNNVRGEALHAALEKEETLRMMINNSHVVFFLLKKEDYWPAIFVSDNVIQFGYTVDDFYRRKFIKGKSYTLKT